MMRIIVSIAALYGSLVFTSQYEWAATLAFDGPLTYGWILSLIVAGTAFSLGRN